MSTFHDALTEPVDAKPAAPATQYVTWFTTPEMSQAEADEFLEKARLAGIDQRLVRYDRPVRRTIPLRPRQQLTQEIEQ